MRYQLDEDKGDLLYEVENDNLILKIKPEVIASIGTPGTGGSGSGIYHIKLNDDIRPSDTNAFTALRALKEIEDAIRGAIIEMDGMFIRKDIDDYALGNIRFHESIGSPDFLTGIEGGNGWKITADGGIEGESAVIRSDAIIGNSIGSRDFASGMFGYGWRIDSPTASGTVDNWTVRKTFKVYELVYSQVLGLNGSHIVSDFNKIKTVTPLDVVIAVRWTIWGAKCS